MINLAALIATLGCLAAPLGDMNMRELGSAKYKRAFIKLYDASLCSTEASFTWDEPFALALEYRREFKGSTIVGATIHEMARLSGQEKDAIEPLRETISQCFPDVGKGDQITGVSEDADRARFYLNGEMTCEVEWPGFRDHFFGIWLGEDTREPNKSMRLKGEN